MATAKRSQSPREKAKVKAKAIEGDRYQDAYRVEQDLNWSNSLPLSLTLQETQETLPSSSAWVQKKITTKRVRSDLDLGI